MAVVGGGNRISGDLDESTRLLCIGAQVDREFADAAIKEFLAQPLRSLPPALGVDPTAVLRECLSGHRRRRIRDGVLSAIMVVFIVTSPSLLMSWIVVATVWRLAGPKRRRMDRAVRPWSGLRGVSSILLATVVLLGSLAWAVKPLFGWSFSAGSPRNFYGDPAQHTASGLLESVPVEGVAVLPLVLSLGMFAVLWFDRQAVWSTVTGRLRRGRFSTATGAAPAIGTGEHARHLTQLEAERVNCVVYRGRRPFVGSGDPLQAWSIAIPLEPSAGDKVTIDKITGDGDKVVIAAGRIPDNGTSLTLVGLHGAVTREIRLLAGETSLSPSRRLSHVRTEGMVYIPARSLANHGDAPELSEVLVSPRRRPNPMISRSLLQHVAENPQEWMRYYASYVVESWEREVTVSVLVHYGLDERNMYIECVPCVLRPVDSRYRAVDGLSDRTSVPAFLDALGSWTVLPLTILPRFIHAVSDVRDEYHYSDDPERLGAAMSLREMAASMQFADYAQEADVNRYSQILQARIIRAIGGHLEECDLSAVEFMRQTASVTNNIAGRDVINIDRGNTHGSNVGGSGNTVAQPNRR